MAGRPISIEVILDAARFLRGSKKVEDGIEDIEDALVDAEKQADDVQRELDRAFDRVGDSAQKAGDRIERGLKESTDGVPNVGAELGDELAQNIGESVASGDLGGIIGDTLGGLTSTFGQLGKGAGVALAAGLGGAGFLFAKLQEDWEKAEERMNTGVDQLISRFEELGLASREVFTEAERETYLRELQELDPQKFSDLRDTAERMGIAFADVGDALTGNEEAFGRLVPQLQEYIREQEVLAAQSGLQSTDQIDNAKDLLRWIEEQNKAYGTAADQQDDINAAMGRRVTAEQELIAELQTEKDEQAAIKERIEELKDANLQNTQEFKNQKQALKESREEAKRLRDEINGLPSEKTVKVFVRYEEAFGAPSFLGVPRLGEDGRDRGP